MLTLAIIKPDAVQAGHAGKVLAHLEAQGFKMGEHFAGVAGLHGVGLYDRQGQHR